MATTVPEPTGRCCCGTCVGRREVTRPDDCCCGACVGRHPATRRKAN
jgi:hypothetical protein